MKVIFHNDDFGLSYGFTDAIKDSLLKGITTSTSIRTNGTALNYALKLAKTTLRSKSFGIHLNLTDGKAFTPELQKANGAHKHNYLSLLIQSNNTHLQKTICREFESQITLLLNNHIPISNLDSEKHVHMIPSIFESACQLCTKYKIPFIRLSREPLFTTPPSNLNLAKNLLLNNFAKQNLKTLQKYHLKTTDAFYGLLHTNHTTPEIIEKALSHAQKNRYQLIEIMGHPAYQNHPKDNAFTSPAIAHYHTSPSRPMETNTFLDPDHKIRLYLQKNRLSHTSYRELIN